MNDVLDALTSLGGADIESADAAGCAELLNRAKRVRGWVDSVEARITSRMRELHDSAGGAPAADQHSRCGGVSAAEGRRKERRSKTIDDVPSFGDALASGEIVAEHVDGLANATSNVDENVKATLLDDQAGLLDDARSMSPEQFARSCRDRARRLERDAGIERNRRQRRQTFLSRRHDAASGMVEGRFALHPELADQIFGPVDREVAAMIAEGERSGDPEFVGRSADRNRLTAEALGRLVSGGHQQRRPAEAEIIYVVDHLTATTGRLHDAGVCETGSGLPVPPTSVRQALCNGRVRPVIVDTDGNALDAGRSVRNANRSQRRALRAMYRSCAFGECDVAFDRCEIHHIVPWEIGGSTDLANLIPMCSRHHHVIHESVWRLDLSPTRTLTVVQPDGAVFAVSEPDVGAPRTPPPETRRQPAA